MLVIAAALWWSLAGGAPQDFLGKTITDVRVEIAGVPVTEAAVLELVETRVGEPLEMPDVRGSSRQQAAGSRQQPAEHAPHQKACLTRTSSA